jgi:hypothetical protein
MANVIKYSTSNPSQSSLRRGNTTLGIGDGNYGPTSTTGFVNGMDIPNGGYVVYSLHNNNPAAYVAQDDNDLPAIARTLGGGDLTILESKIFLNAHANTWILSNIPPNIVTDGLVYYSDGGDMTSFMNNEPTVNLANTDASRTLGQYADNTVASADAPEKGQDWKKVTITARGTNFRTAKFPYITQPTSTIRTYSLEIDFNGTSGYYIRGDGFTGFGHNQSTSGIYTSTVTTTSTSGVLALFLNNNTTSVTGINDVIYYRYYQVEDNPSKTPFTSGTRSQNTLLNDLSGESNNGTLTNGPTFNTNGWFDFDGVDDYINGQDSVPLGNPCTVMALINCNSGGSGAGVVFGSEANGSDNWLEINNTSVQLFATRIADTDNFTLSGGTLVCDGTRWYNIAMTIDGATAKIYLDGVEVNSVTQQFTIGDWTGTFDIGRRGKVSQRYFKGSISNVIGYNKSLSEDELRQNYYQAPIVTDGLVFAADAGNLVSYESGSATTYSMTGSDTGTLTNGVGFDSANGGVWTFDGTDDQLTTNQLSGRNPATNPFTIEAWVKSDQTVTSRMWIDATSNGTNQRFYATLINGSTSNIGIQGSGWNDSTPNDTNWHYQAIVMDGSTARGYDNGVEVQTKPYTSYTLAGPLNIGGRSGYRWLGQIANFKIYNRALSAAEITQNYNAQVSRFQ